MKYLIVLGDGMADEAIDALNGLTPMQAAHTPVMDFMAREGRCGGLETVPEGFTPGSEIANMTLLGYDVHTQFEGRGSLEAASMGVDIPQGWMAARCNLICVENGCIKNHSAGHISNREAAELIDYLNQELGSEDIKFCAGISYRHLLLMRAGNKHIQCAPPHDEIGRPCHEVMVQALPSEASDNAASNKAGLSSSQATADAINALILKSQEILPKHPVNQARKAAGKDMANSIWPWSPGYRPSMPTLAQQFPMTSGAVISAVDLIKGIGVYAGLESIEVEGATGLYDTNYEGKAEAAIQALKEKDFVFLHVEASDEASHEGDVDLKIKTIEYLDHRLIEPIFKEVTTWDEPVSIAVLPDHPTFCRLKTHVSQAVPFLIWRNDAARKMVKTSVPDKVQTFDELAVMTGSYGILRGKAFMQKLFDSER